jgi:predicted nuclease of restriction endonuclease-like RecB superfamily
MLRSEHSIVHFDRGRATPDRLTRVTHRHYLDYAQRMLAAYGAGVGSTRRELHRAIRNILDDEPDCPRQRIAAFGKLLDDASEFDTDRRGEAAKLRLKVFSLAARFHPLVTAPDQIFERSERETKSRIAQELARSWSDIEGSLYVDVIDHQPLKSFEGFASPEALLSAYNLAQLQACLYKAQRMSVEVRQDFAAIVRYAKLARLLLEIRRIAPNVYRIDLTGPATVLQETRRYGINFARFVAALVSCRGWKLRATVATPWNSLAELSASSDDGYRSHVESPPAFDSEVESSLAEQWGDVRDGWQLIRDAGVLCHGQITFVPDFLLRHGDGREIYLEIVGFWTPEYLNAKRITIGLFKNHRILLAVPKRTAKVDVSRPGVVVYGSKLKPEQILDALKYFPSIREDSCNW